MADDVVTASTALSIEKLGRLIAAKRGARGVRAAAMDVGVSPATLSRVENGHMPDLETFAKICRWLGRDPREFLGLDAEQNSTPISDRLSDDIVTELDAWLDVTSGEPDEQWLAERPMVQRARDEIVALRDRNRSSDVRAEHLQRDARDEALEEAAMVANRWKEPEFDRGAAIASAIRALKEDY